MNKFTNPVKVQKLFPLSNRYPTQIQNRFAYSREKAPDGEEIKFPVVHTGGTYPTAWSLSAAPKR